MSIGRRGWGDGSLSSIIAISFKFSCLMAYTVLMLLPRYIYSSSTQTFYHMFVQVFLLVECCMDIFQLRQKGAQAQIIEQSRGWPEEYRHVRPGGVLLDGFKAMFGSKYILYFRGLGFLRMLNQLQFCFNFCGQSTVYVIILYISILHNDSIYHLTEQSSSQDIDGRFTQLACINLLSTSLFQMKLQFFSLSKSCQHNRNNHIDVIQIIEIIQHCFIP